jgi:ABC-type cobalamin transport system ATPase subunit
MAKSLPKLSLPQLRRVRLRRFSLYAANPDADFTCRDGVTCVIGANGLGKSTLLSAINFGLTGIVPDPGRRFESMEEYYTDSRRYSRDYFRGRITENDRQEAEITLNFEVGAAKYELRRGLFEPEELRGFRVNGDGDEIDTSEVTHRERHSLYETRLIKDTGLSSFPEFVFLQLFVFTFDERRMTLFWNEKVLERALYLSFGLNPDAAKRVDELRREHDSADSQVRNRQWEATRTRKRVNELREKFQSTDAAQQSYDTLLQDQDRLLHGNERELNALESTRTQLRDANLRLATLSAKQSALQDEYAQFFERTLERRPPLAQHPLLAKALTENVCGLCGAMGEGVQRVVRTKLEGKDCPVCDTPLPTSAAPTEDIARLKKVDREIARTKQGLRDVLKELERLRTEEVEAQRKLDAAKEELAVFEQANEAAMLSLRQSLSEGGGVDALLSSYRAQLGNLLAEKKDAEKRRADVKKLLNERQRELQKQYLSVERKFVPLFTDLAYHFLGMPMEIKMTTSELAAVGLFLEVRGTARRELHQLSESQRFFLDIALRMALTQFVSDPGARGGLFIDTPEGSLDIAYEKRAGEMLAKFAGAGHPIFMTANLNSSKLLLALATNCGRDKMHLCRMTDWAELSEVQQEEEGLFEEAYAQIEQALGS